MNQQDDRGSACRSSLLSRAAELRDRVDRVRSDLKRERDPMPKDFSDAAIRMENDEVLEAIEQSATLELNAVNAALERISQGTFGLCVQCAGEIEAERLTAVPHATHCRRCAPGS